MPRRQPPPRPCLRRDTRALLPALPPRPRLRRDTHALLPAAPTPPAPSALLPRPLPGARAVLAISGEQPYPGCSRRAAVHWTVGISRLGVAARGVGELVPPPLSLTLQAPCFSLPAFLRGIPMHFCRRPPPRPCLRRSSPAPSRGRGQCLRYQVGSRARFFPRISPCSGPWGYRHGGWRLAGRGNSFPLPCLQLPRHRNPCGPTPPAPP